MTVIIRIQSPQLKRLVRPRKAIERLPPFVRCARSFAGKQLSPFAVWSRSIMTVIACLCLAMVASLEPAAVPTLGQVSDSLAGKISPPAAAQRTAKPENSFPLGSVPPLQSPLSPEASLDLVIAEADR